MNNELTKKFLCTLPLRNQSLISSAAYARLGAFLQLTKHNFCIYGFVGSSSVKLSELKVCAV